MSSEEKNNLSKYLIIIDEFVSTKITASEFEKEFLEFHRNDNFKYSEKVATALSVLFSDIDSFCDDIKIANYNKSDPFYDINEKELRDRSNNILQKLRYLSNVS